MKKPRTTCVPLSIIKLRSKRGPNCDEARVKATIVIEKAILVTVIIAPAMVPSKDLVELISIL